MPRYSAERKAALLKKLLPPINLSVAEVARQEGVSEMYPLHKPHLPIARRSLEAELPFSPEFIP